MAQEDLTIFVRNLNNKVTEELLFELFLQAGPLDTVKIPTAADGTKRTYAFIVFKHVESVPYALQLLDNLKLFKRPIYISSRSTQQHLFPPSLPNTPVRERIGARVDDSACLRPGSSAARRFTDRSMLPSNPSRTNSNKHEAPRSRDIAWGLSGSLDNYPSQRGNEQKGMRDLNRPDRQSRNNNDWNNRGISNNYRKPYDHHFDNRSQREKNRYDSKPPNSHRRF